MQCWSISVAGGKALTPGLVSASITVAFSQKSQSPERGSTLSIIVTISCSFSECARRLNV
jgi:hypothetical protein